MLNTEFVIFVTGRYHWLLEPLLYFYEKYMPVPLTFFSDRPIEGCNAVEVFSKDMRIYHEPCGKLIKDALRNLKKPIVMFGYMDLLPIREVDLRLLGILEQYMAGNCHVARGNLWAGAQWQIQPFPVILEHPGFTIHKLPATGSGIGAVGSTTLLPALWRVDFLLDFIEDDWPLDRIESIGPTKFSQQSWWYSIATFPGLFDMCHLLLTASPYLARLSTIPNVQDRAYVAQFVPEGYELV